MTTVWKGHLTFGLISIPVKLFRAARAEKISFRQLHGQDHSRVRQTYVREEPPDAAGAEDEVDEAPPVVSEPAKVRSLKEAAAFHGPSAPASPPGIVDRTDIVKGYEFAPDRYVVVTKRRFGQNYCLGKPGNADSGIRTAG